MKIHFPIFLKTRNHPTGLLLISINLETVTVFLKLRKTNNCCLSSIGAIISIKFATYFLVNRGCHLQSSASNVNNKQNVIIFTYIIEYFFTFVIHLSVHFL
mgnify:CR=1 FL=1